MNPLPDGLSHILQLFFLVHSSPDLQLRAVCLTQTHRWFWKVITTLQDLRNPSKGIFWFRMRDIVRLDLIVLGQLSQKIHAGLIKIPLTKGCSIGFLAGIGPDDNLHTFSMQEIDQVFLFGRKTSKAINDQSQIRQIIICVASQNMLGKSSNLRRRIKIPLI